MQYKFNNKRRNTSISPNDKVKLIKAINDAKVEVERLRILDIMNKICR